MVSPYQLKIELEALDIIFKTYQHPPLADCQEAERLKLQRSGTQLKNLFLQDNYGRRHFLLITAPEKQIDLKLLPNLLGTSRIGFASARRLKKYLGVEPGCVSLLSLINDTEQQVELLVDANVWQNRLFQCHPLINTETLVIEKSDLMRFLEITGHQPTLLPL